MNEYQKYYQSLVESLEDVKVMVFEYSGYGCCFHSKDYWAIIYIKADLSFKHKIMVLCHEIGHLFEAKFREDQISFKSLKNPARESKAHRTALNILETLFPNFNEKGYWNLLKQANFLRKEKRI
jgi:Zn-dependent peptidase ImmA (M78 family)